MRHIAIAFALALSTVAGCAVEDDAELATDEAELTAAATAYVLHVSSDEGAIRVTKPGPVHETCPGYGGCDFAFLGGTPLTIKPVQPTDRINCVKFARWIGACAGQGSTCSITINSNLSTHAEWDRILGCIPM
jgi:hypothetical protein